jgi:hypothetical protein
MPPVAAPKASRSQTRRERKPVRKLTPASACPSSSGVAPRKADRVLAWACDGVDQEFVSSRSRSLSLRWTRARRLRRRRRHELPLHLNPPRSRYQNFSSAIDDRALRGIRRSAGRRPGSRGLQSVRRRTRGDKGRCLRRMACDRSNRRRLSPRWICGSGGLRRSFDDAGNPAR